MHVLFFIIHISSALFGKYFEVSRVNSGGNLSPFVSFDILSFNYALFQDDIF